MTTNWQTLQIKDCCNVRRGASPRPIDNPEYFGGSIGWVRISDVTCANKYLRKTTDYLSPLGESKSVRVFPGDLIMSICGSIGKPIILDMDACIHDGFVQFTDIRGLDTEFFYYLLHNLVPKFLSRGQSGTQSNLNTTIVGDEYFNCPPILEQKKIAQILSDTDTAISKNQITLNKLTNLKKALMQEVFTKGIGHKDFKDSPIGKIPKHWRLCKLSNVLESIFDCEHKTAPTDTSGHFRIVGTTDVKNGNLIYSSMRPTNEKTYKEWTNRAIPVNGDIIFTREAPAGEAALVPPDWKVCLGQRTVLLRPNKSIINPSFLLYSFYSPFIRKKIESEFIGTTVTRINMADIKKILCIVPPVEEQKIISNSISSVDNRIRILHNKLDSLNSLKQALMQDLLSGRVRVK